MAARNGVVIPDCEDYESGNCFSLKGTLPCPKHEKMCCCVCNEHMACFTSFRFGCGVADHEEAVNTFSDMANDMWVNRNKESHCPMDGHL